MLQQWIERAAGEREAWKYTTLKPLAAETYRAAPPPRASIDRLPSIMPDAADRHRLVFVDGYLQKALCLLGGLPENIISGDTDSGYDISLSKETCLAVAPLELIHVATADDGPRTGNTEMRIRLGASGRLTLIEHHLSLGGSPYVALRENKIILGDHAKLVHVRLQGMDTAHTQLTHSEIAVASGAFYDQFALTTGAGLSRHEVRVQLCGTGAQTRLAGMMLLRGRQHADTTTLIEHLAPATSSREVYRTVLDGSARGVFQGKILVAPGAQKTDGHQLSRALMLSGTAEMNAKPELEIYADDVKCSHGATVGQIDETALFYLRSRGIPAPDARALLVRGFVSELIDEAALPVVREELHARVGSWLEGAGS
ncbi:MAG: Fe-S cluster assembly protein SufD [Alphaproteobacteria bacterium]|nr:Fe-S cluster assembly protein SufD [Alphaproteobacteria bacterium]